MIDHEAYPGVYRCNNGGTAIVETLGGNYVTGYIDLPVPMKLWWHLDGRVDPSTDGPHDLHIRKPDPLPVRLRRWWQRYWRGK